MPKLFLIRGGTPLSGQVNVSGSKNSAGALLASSLLSGKDVTLDNVPFISDILHQIEIIKEMGGRVQWTGPKSVKVNTKDIDPAKIPAELFERMRLSVLLMGPLLTRFPKFKVPHPGGDKIGIRPIDTHLHVLEEFGAKVEQEGRFYSVTSPKVLKGKHIVLKEFSVTATENAMMIASAARGKSIIELAAAEPHVQDLGELLKNMGVNVRGIGTHTIEIVGPTKFKEASFRVSPDSLEAGTFLIAFAATGGEGTVKNMNPAHLTAFLDKLKEIGVPFKTHKNSVKVLASQRNFKPSKVQVLPYPGFPTDLQPQISVLLTRAKGKSLIHDPLYENRFAYLNELRKMGADVEVTDPHRALIFEQRKLVGTKVQSPDIRAGATIVLAGLMARGETVIEDIAQIERGHGDFAGKLRNLGARIDEI